MKQYYLKYSAFSVFLFMAHMLFAQNFVYNGGFEDGDHVSASQTNNSGSPHFRQCTANYLDNWVRSSPDEECFHSPDWFRKEAPSNNFQGQSNSNLQDNARSSTPGTLPPFFYEEIFPHTGNGMLGMYTYELIQQKFDQSGLKNALDNSNWQSLTLKFWVRPSNQLLAKGLILKVYMASGDMKYKDNTPGINKGICDTDDYYCTDKLKEYKILPTNREEILSIENIGTIYPVGSWHQVSYTFNVPAEIYANINAYDWLMFDLHYPNPENNGCNGGYLFLDDIELLVGCEDECSRTDGAISNPMLDTTVNATNAFSMSTGINNLNSLRLEIFANTGALATFDETVTCINGIDHTLYWSGTNAGGSPVANGIYQYRITTVNDCGSQVFTGSLLKEANYTGANVTNFHLGCTNGVNVTPEPCCWLEPTFYINNEVLIGPDPGWSQYFIPEHIWACTAQPDYSDEVVVASNARVHFRAGKQITLREGFNVQAGAAFIAEIETCGRTERLHAGSTTASSLQDLSTEGQQSDNFVKIYPNPVADLTTIELLEMDPSHSVYYCQIYDLMGKELKAFTLLGKITGIDLSDYPEGMYLLQITNGQVKQTLKIVKK